MLKTIAAGGRFQQIEGFRQRRDGSPVAVVFSIFPITGEDGAIIGGSCIVHDITSRKRMEEQLRRSEERFRLLAQATKDALSDRDLRNEAMWRSDNFWEQFGYSRKEVEPDVGAWRELIHPEDRDRVVKGFQTALARHADSHEVEYRFRRADDSYAVVLERTYIIYGESGEPIRALSAMTDLSDRRQLGALDAGMAGGAEGDEARELGEPGRAVMDDEQGARAAALTFMKVAGEYFGAQPGKVSPVPALPLVAAPAPPRRIQFLGAAGAEQRPLPEKGPAPVALVAREREGRSRRLGDGDCAHISSLTYDNGHCRR
jgi:PAS domain S-box-containing protein